jgi:hypothetical protein
MKKIRFFTKPRLLLGMVTLAATAIGIISCNKVNEHVYSQITTSNFFQTASQVESAYVQPYSFIATHIYQVHFALAEFATDEAVCPARYGYVDQDGMWNRLHQHNWVTDDAWINTEWNDMYQAIGYANYFIDAIQNVDVSKMTLPVPKAQMIAEAKMVRDLHYYWLLDEFGNVPIVEHLGVVNPPTVARAGVFAYLVKDINANMPLLGHKGDATWYGHFTQEAAHALLAKLYLNAQIFTGTQQYAACITECDAVINSGKFSLDATWDAPFLAHNEASAENIFVVPFDSQHAIGFNAAQQQIHWDEAPPKYGIGDGWAKVVSQESFYDQYASNDLRINQWLVGPQTYVDQTTGKTKKIIDDDGNQLTLTPQIQSLGEDGADNAYSGVANVKYQIEYGIYNMNNDDVVFRLGDIMDMKAECEMRQNGGTATADAVALVNAVRARSFKTGAVGSTYTTSTLTLDELLNERGREFSYEMHRREDMIRFGHFNDAWWEKPATDAHYELYPIPYIAITGNSALKQNPGY